MRQIILVLFVIALSITAHAQSVFSQEQINDYFGQPAGTVTNPPANTGRVYFDTASATMKCLTSTGASCFSSSGSGSVGPGTVNTIPVFNASTTIGNSLLTDNGITLTYSGTGGFSTTGANGGITGTEGTGAGLTAGAGVDLLWADSTAHRWKMNPNAAGALIVSGISAAGTAGNFVKLAANGIDLADSSDPSTVVNTGYLIPTGGFPTILASAAPADTQNELECLRFIAPNTITATRFTYLLANSAGSSTHVGFAIYDTTGASTRLMTTGAQDGTSVGQHIITVSSFTLQQGTPYLFCWTTDSGSAASWQVYGVNSTASTLANLINANTINRVKGGTASVAGAPPATTGTLTAKTGSGTIPLAFIEP